LLVPQPKRKLDQLEALPPLETPEQVQRSMESDLALNIRAQRRQEESAAASRQVAADRDHFELTRDKIIFGFQLVGAVATLIVALILVIVNPDLVRAALAGAGLGGLGVLLRRRAV
jgi:hypothetical protein